MDDALRDTIPSRVSLATRMRSRRVLVAGVAAVAASMAGQTAQSAAAADPNDVVLGGVNPPMGTASSTTAIHGTVNDVVFFAGNLDASSNPGGAIQGTTNGGYGVCGGSGGGVLTFRNAGVIGGVPGASNPPTILPRGAYGSASAFGVHGRSTTGVGVYGESASPGSTQPGVSGGQHRRKRRLRCVQRERRNVRQLWNQRWRVRLIGRSWSLGDVIVATNRRSSWRAWRLDVGAGRLRRCRQQRRHLR